MSQIYSATTHDIRIDVEPSYMPQRSQPERSRWVWAYTIVITNGGAQTVQLKQRNWAITDAQGRVEHVRGPGVVGEQPILNAGDIYRYTSSCPLGTASGFMEGFYTFQTDDGTRFDVAVPPFSLDLPQLKRALN